MKPLLCCTRLPFTLSAALLSICATTVAHAQSVYLGTGFLGLQAGYAHRINEALGARAELMGLPGQSKSHTESGTTFNAKVSWSRLSALADWHPSQNSGFRVTAGISSNNMGLGLTAATIGGKVDINGKSYEIKGEDSFKVKVKMPSSTPYVGIGYGHHANQKGLGFHADLGLLVGGFKLTESRTGALVNGGAAGITQADVDAELKSARSDLNKMKVLPQLTLGLAYRF